MSDNYNNTNKKVKDLILIISGPSGSGKGTVIDMLIEQFGCRKAVSVTTRNIRPGEIDGRDYKFVTRKKFDDMLKNGELLEYNIYGDNCYGTPKYEVEEALNSGTRLILDVDVHGAENVMKLYPDVRSIFILPPSASEQRKRIEKRGSNTPEQIEKRMKIAQDEIKCWPKYDCVIVNETGPTTKAHVPVIINSGYSEGGASRSRSTLRGYNPLKSSTKACLLYTSRCV